MRNECYFAILLSAAEDLGITWVVAGFFVWSIHYQLPLLRYPYNPLSLCHITLPPSPSYLPISSISSLYLSQPILIFLPKYLNIIAADTGAVSVLSFSWKNFNRDRSSPERRRRISCQLKVRQEAFQKGQPFIYFCILKYFLNIQRNERDLNCKFQSSEVTHLQIDPLLTQT